MYSLKRDHAYAWKIEEIVIRDISIEKQIELTNTIADYIGDNCIHIYAMEELNDVLTDCVPYDILQRTSKDFSLDDKYFNIDHNGFLHSFDRPFPNESLPDDEIATYMIDQNDACGIPAVQAILDARAQETKGDAE